MNSSNSPPSPHHHAPITLKALTYTFFFSPSVHGHESQIRNNHPHPIPSHPMTADIPPPPLLFRSCLLFLVLPCPILSSQNPIFFFPVCLVSFYCVLRESYTVYLTLRFLYIQRWSFIIIHKRPTQFLPLRGVTYLLFFWFFLFLLKRIVALALSHSTYLSIYYAYDDVYYYTRMRFILFVCFFPP
jgi:hypothetical protein